MVFSLAHVTEQVLQLVTGFLPLWYKDSEVERVEWMNKVLKKVCAPTMTVSNLPDYPLRPAFLVFGAVMCVT